MINTVKSSMQLGDPADQRSARQQREEGVLAKSRGKSGGAQSELRLMIEHDEARGGLIYKLINRATGEVVAEMSREDLLKLSEDPSYTAGALFSTNA